MKFSSNIFLISVIIQTLLVLFIIISLVIKNRSYKLNKRPNHKKNRALKKFLDKNENILDECFLISKDKEKHEKIFLTDKKIFTIVMDLNKRNIKKAREVVYNLIDSVSLLDSEPTQGASLQLELNDESIVCFEIEKTKRFSGFYETLKEKVREAELKKRRDV